VRIPNMDTSTLQPSEGPLDVRYRAFLETLSTVRPALHRYCARMTGSVMDGEDIVQDALFDAYRKLDTFDDSRPLSPWLFRIAHNRCIDSLRRRGVRIEAESILAAEPTWFEPEPPFGSSVKVAIEHLVIHLPPMERACVLLKEVFDYSLQETAELVGSTVGGVKAALHRGRAKLAEISGPYVKPRVADPELTRLLHLYVERFNERDWNGLRELITADARLQVGDRYLGSLSNAPYFGIYECMTVPWSMAVGEADGEPVVICRRWAEGSWTPDSLIRIQRDASQISRVIDYLHCPWVFAAAQSVGLIENTS
jgi:RNA polymerase sigma-70 factor (ECF subfamily)